MPDELTDDVEQTGETETTEQDNAADREHQDDDAADDGTYPAKVVRDLRKENASYRERARTAEARVDELSRALFTARVDATGKVENAAEVPYNADVLNSPDAINQAVDTAIADRPYIQKRKASGNIGQGERGAKAAPQDFSSLLR